MKKKLAQSMATSVLACMLAFTFAACSGSDKVTSSAAETSSQTSVSDVSQSSPPSEAPEATSESSELTESVASESSSQEESSAATDDAAISDEDYVAKVKGIMDKIQSISASAFTDVDSTDIAAVGEATKKMAEEVKPLYEELKDLQSPDTYVQAQEKITAGADASVKLLEISIELLSNPEDTEKVADLQSQTVEWAVTAQQLTAGLAELGIQIE